MKKRFLILFLCGCILGISACEKEEIQEKSKESIITEDIWEKGYYLPVEEEENKEAEQDCKKVLEFILDIYENANKGMASNVVLSDEVVFEMQRKVKELDYPVTTTIAYSSMENYEKADNFFKECIEGKNGSIVVYEIHSDGSIGRMKFIFDGIDMYVIGATGVWNSDNQPSMAYISHTRIKEWNYTEKGWFCYELCVPEVPEVSESVDGSCVMRIKPMTEEHRRMSEKYVKVLGYQGNNLLCSNWDKEHLEKLDYNGVYEYFYEMKYGETLRSETYPNGIPKEEFENLIMEYLTITKEQIREYAIFDEENQTYLWEAFGHYTYTPTFFGTSLPEVVNRKENEDGTITLTVEAVCDIVLCDDAVITHELTIQLYEDGSFKYLGNKILNDGIENIPEYESRFN